MMQDLEDEDETRSIGCDQTCSNGQSGPESNLFGSLSHWSLTPSKVSQSTCVGGMLQRTFIQLPPPPPTPVNGRGTALSSGARRRSLSVPKDFGSPKSVFEDALHSLVYLHRPVHSVPVSEVDDASSKCESPVIESLAALEVGPVPYP